MFNSHELKFGTKGHSTHETESVWPLHFKHSCWWKRRNQSEFASHYAWGTNGVCECKMDVKSTWIPTWHRMDNVTCHWDCSQKPHAGDRPNKNLRDHGTLNAHNRYHILFYHVWGLAWTKIHWKSIWLKSNNMTSLHLKIRDHTSVLPPE